MIIFESGRLVVRQFTASDGDIFFAHNGNTELMRYIRPVKTRAESDAFLMENLRFYQQQPGLGRFAVMTKETVDFAGSFSLLPFGNTGEVHLGYVVMRPFWGQGFATEIAKAGLRYAQGLGYKQVLGFTDPENLVSQKVLLKAGFFGDGFIDYQGQPSSKFVYKF